MPDPSFFEQNGQEVQVAKGLFVGLVTLDWIYLVQELPQPNQKIVALEDAWAAGGPATNAAVTFNHLGHQATVLGSVGHHAISQLVRSELQGKVAIADLSPDRVQPVPTSSILVTQATGERAVISRNAVQFQAKPSDIPEHILQDIDILLIDGHQMAVSQALAQQAKHTPVVLDGGSWKTGLEQVLPHVDYAICSANFRPPEELALDRTVLDYLQSLGIPDVAVTHGDRPIEYVTQGRSGQIDVPTIQAVDTLGAGDVFHGAFCHFILQMDFVAALTEASTVAALACQSFGTRAWMRQV